MYTVDYRFSEFGLPTTDGCVVSYVTGRAEIEVTDGFITDVDIWLEDDVRYPNGTYRADRLNEADPFYRMVRDEIQRLWAAGKIERPSSETLAEWAAADAAENERSHRLAMAG